MNSCSQAVQQLLTTLTTKISNSPAVLKAQEIGNALYSLQSMGTSSLAVQQLLTALIAKLTDPLAVLNVQADFDTYCSTASPTLRA